MHCMDGRVWKLRGAVRSYKVSLPRAFKVLAKLAPGIELAEHSTAQHQQKQCSIIHIRIKMSSVEYLRCCMTAQDDWILIFPHLLVFILCFRRFASIKGSHAV